MKIREAALHKRFDALGWGLFAVSVVGSIMMALYAIFYDSISGNGDSALSLIGHPVHFVLEMASILVCMAIFLVAVFSYPFLPNTRFLAAGYTFFATGIVDAIHLIGDNGILLFPYPEQLGIRSAFFQIVSRLFLAGGLLFSLTVADRRKKRVRMIPWFIGEVLAMALIIALIAWNPARDIWVLPDGSAGLTIKMLQCVSAVFLLAGLIVVLFQYFTIRDRIHLITASALVILLTSEWIASSVMLHSLHGDGLAHLLRLFAQLLLFYVFFVNGIRRPYVMLRETRDALNQYANDLDKQVEVRTAELTVANTRLLNDVAMARDVQRSMLPVELPQGEFVRFSAGYVPAEQLSGDFYDVYRMDQHRFGLCVGDVAGHGVSAAMLTVFAFQGVQTLLEESRGAGALLPSFVLKHLYDSFNAANFRDELYMVMFYGVYNQETGILSYASGGLNTMPVRVRPDGSLQAFESEGLAICKMGEFVQPNYKNRQMLLFPGDKLVVYTDGLVEARSPEGVAYTQERLHRLLVEGAKLGADALRDTILADVQAFSGKMVPSDDITLLITEILLPF